VSSEQRYCFGSVLTCKKFVLNGLSFLRLCQPRKTVKNICDYRLRVTFLATTAFVDILVSKFRENC